MSPDPAALDEGRKHARIQGYTWDRRAYESFAVGWALGVAEGRRQRDEAVGICGDRATALIGFPDRHDTCDLPAGHAGWHGRPNPGGFDRMSWTNVAPCHCNPLAWAGSDAVDVIADTVREARGE